MLNNQLIDGVFARPLSLRWWKDASPSLTNALVLIKISTRKASGYFWFIDSLKLNYQITIRLLGAIYILSVFLTLKVSYHSGKLRGGILVRKIFGP